ncbi:hypothetical protein ACIOD2_32185 [Amycolatopsis sp. NPDC088138]|uniref:hypothetical protein n=1 Tax=Amycolatopsis sp. NPDC088138 TaxID=3363938 RepID=UPI003807A39E
MTQPEPIPLHVVRWRCTFCPRSRSSKTATVKHIGRCWLNPAVRGCKTCVHYSLPSGCPGGYDCNCPPETEDCAAGLDLTEGLRTSCPKWEAA